MSTIRIHTTQNVSLEYEIASVGDRIVAALIDYGLYITWFIAWSVLNRQLHIAGDGKVGFYLILLPTTFYFLVSEVFFNGQTIGKKPATCAWCASMAPGPAWATTCCAGCCGPSKSS
ncbi:RDD family protein [Hymenobacter humi]|uniref:RDD family protein n=1 Tax=Hymenobacter humi TaxID=1411620 RepID=A0ABW2U4P7_9BACT